MSTCLSEFALDDLILSGDGPASRNAASHLQGCPDCQRRHDERQAALAAFERAQAEPFWRATRRGYQRRRRIRRAFVLGVPFGAALVCAWAFLPHGPKITSGGYLGAKGTGAIEIHCRRAGRTFRLEAGASVEPGDELRFVPRPAWLAALYVQIASVDGTDRYTPFYPPDLFGSSLPLPPAGQPLDGSIRLDSAPGPERVFFVFSSVPLPVSVVQQVARQHVADLRPVVDIAGAHVESGWIVLDKTAIPSRAP